MWTRLEWEESGLTDNPFHHVVVAVRIAIRLAIACGARRQRVRVQSLEGAIWCGLWDFEWRRVNGWCIRVNWRWQSPSTRVVRRGRIGVGETR